MSINDAVKSSLSRFFANRAWAKVFYDVLGVEWNTSWFQKSSSFDGFYNWRESKREEIQSFESKVEKN